MAIARIQYALGGASVNDTCTVTLTGTVAGRTILLLHQFDGTSQSVSSITCSGETVEALTPNRLQPPDNGNTRYWIIKELQSGGSKTITVLLTASPGFNNQIAGWELDDVDLVAPFDAELFTNGTSSVAAGNITTVAANAAIFSYTAGNSGAPSVGSGFTLESSGPAHWYEGLQYKLDAGSAGSQAAGFTGTSQSTWLLHAVSLKPAGGGGFQSAWAVNANPSIL